LSLSFCFYLNAISTFFLNFSLWSLSYKFHIIIREPHIDINGACASNWTVPKTQTKSSIHIHNGIIIIFNHFSVSFCFCLCHVNPFPNFSLCTLSYKFHIIIREPHIKFNVACVIIERFQTPKQKVPYIYTTMWPLCLIIFIRNFSFSSICHLNLHSNFFLYVA
jgi:hypothetical protein